MSRRIALLEAVRGWLRRRRRAARGPAPVERLGRKRPSVLSPRANWWPHRPGPVGASADGSSEPPDEAGADPRRYPGASRAGRYRVYRGGVAFSRFRDYPGLCKTGRVAGDDASNLGRPLPPHSPDTRRPD